MKTGEVTATYHSGFRFLGISVVGSERASNGAGVVRVMLRIGVRGVASWFDGAPIVHSSLAKGLLIGSALGPIMTVAGCDL